MLVIALLSVGGCRGHTPTSSDEVEPVKQSEPDQYSATVIRTVDDSEVSVTRIARSGEMRREEWGGQGGRRALISRPDMGKTFLLDLDRQIYVELDSGPLASRQPEPGAPNESTAQGDESGVRPDALERAFDDAPTPARVEVRALADQSIENQSCRVFEQRAGFDDGHTEITRIFCARDLNDLAIRVESESEGGVKVITERRDVNTQVAPEQFVVPPGFKKVNRLAQ